MRRGWIVIALAGVFAGWTAGQVEAAGKTRVTKLDELPRHTYPIQGTASELLLSREALMPLAAQVKKDTQEILEKYDIQDRNTLQSLYGTLQTVAFLEGDEAKVRAYLDKIRSLEEKEANRLTQGLVSIPFYEAAHETGKSPDSEAFRASFRKHFAAAVARLPWEVVQDDLEQMKGQLEMLSTSLLQGLVASTIDPAVAKSGYLSGDLAAQLLSQRQLIEMFLPVKEEVVSVLGEAVAANRVEKANIWPDRAVVLGAADAREKVRVGIWDTGVDVAVFPPSQVWTNPRETEDGKDEDGNGFVDDLHGIAHDKDHDRTPLILYPLGDAAARRDKLEGSFKGFFDLQAALDTPEATELKHQMSALKPEEVRAFVEDLSLYVHHAHGTHVAGIAIDGNPHAEIVVARLGTDHRLIPDPPTMELTEKLGAEFRETVDYFRAAGVRVVNMSWVLAEKGFEDDLEKNGIGKDQEERARMAREMFAVAKEELHKAFESAPEILFVGGAGNSDNDVDFDEFIPPAFEMPNLLIAGAVDQSGEATDFTSFGRGVDVYSNGFEVDSYVPGGNRMKLSGTSMASPNVVNLAAKLFALDPSLTPAMAAELIRKGAEPHGENGKLLVIHPKRSVELLREMQKERG